MTKYCETCKKPIPQGLTSCPVCNGTILLEPEAGKPVSDPSWSDLVNAPANVGEQEETLVASVVDEPPQEPLAKKVPPKTQLASAQELARVVHEPQEEELVAQVVDEPADQPLVAQVVDEPHEKPLIAKVVDEPEEESLVAQVADEPQEEQLVAQVVDEPQGEALVANVVDEPGDQVPPADVVDELAKEPEAAKAPAEELGDKVVDESVSDQALAALIEESSDHAEPVEEIAGEVTENPVSPESTIGDEPDSDVNLGAPVEKGPSEMDRLAAESAGTPSESMLDDVFASGQLPIEESTSAVDLGSSSVLEIPDEILKAAERHEEADKATPDETRLQLASMPDETEEEVMDLGEVGEAKAEPAKPAPKRAKKPIEPKSPKTKLGKKSIPTQLVPESEADEDATLAEEPKPVKPARKPQPKAEQPAEATEQIEAVDESDVVSEAVDEEELTAVVDEDKSAEETLLAEEEAASVAEEDTGAVAEEPVKAKGKKARRVEADDEGALAGLAEGEAESTAVAVEDEEPTKKAKTARPIKPRYGRRWLGGISLGLILGVLGYFGLWAYNIQPLDNIEQMQQVRKLTGVKTSASSSSAPAVPAKPKEDAHKLLAEGQFSQAIEAFKTASSAQTSSPKDLAAQGEATWLAYLQKQKGNVKPGDADVKSASELFNKALQAKGSGEDDTAAKAQALLWLGEIDERTNHVDEARKKYTTGVKDYPKQKRFFQAQLDRLGESGAADTSWLPGKEKPSLADAGELNPHDAAALLALMLVAFQGPAGSGESAEEAAPDFFQALVLAQSGNYDDALKKLQSARKIHDEQRFNRLRKAQNPKSDPLEESFLKACDELKTYIEIRKSLKEHGYLEPGKIAVDKVDNALKEARLANDTLQAVSKKFKDAKIDEPDVAKAVDGLIKDKGTLDEVKAKLKDAKLDDAEVPKAVESLLKEHDTLDGVAKQLKKADLNDKDVPKSVEGLIKDRDTLLSVAAKLKDNKIDDTDVPKSVDGLIESRKQVEALSAALDKAGIKDKDPVKAVDAAISQRDKSNDRLGGIVKKLETMKILSDGSKPEDIDGGLKTIEQALDKGDPQGNLRTMLDASNKEIRQRKDELVKLEDRRKSELKDAEDRRLKETGDLKAVLAERHPPQEMLQYWSSLLPVRGTPEDDNKAALKDVERVRADKQSKAADKGRALFIEGLAERNLGDYDKARKKLTDAKDYDGVTEDVAKASEKALAELTDIGVYYLPEMNRAINFGRFDAATAYLTEAEKVFPAENGRLAFQRGILLLEKARAEAGEKKITDDSPAVKDVRDAAKAAEEAGSKADAAYLVGRLEEELAKLLAAREQYEQAVKLLDKDSPNSSAYQLALARVLWKIHRATPSPVGPRLGKAEGRNREEALVALFADDVEKLPPGVTREGKQADDIAKELEKKLAESEYLLKAQALGIQGRWDEALKVYLNGVQGHMRRDQFDALMIIIDNHPGLRQPPFAEIPNPKLAEQYWGTGLSKFWAKQYPEAEKLFFEACKYDSQDARYRYFLGLSQWLQNLPIKQDDAKLNFRQGADLERTGRPASDAVNASLERIQGELRKKLNEFRP